MTSKPTERSALFVPAWLDDAGLDPLVFRFLARASRRGERFTEGAKGLASMLGSTRETARALRNLMERADVLVLTKPGGRGRGHTPEYRANPESLWKLDVLREGIPVRKRDLSRAKGHPKKGALEAIYEDKGAKSLKKRARWEPFSEDVKGRAGGPVKGRAGGLEKGALEATKVYPLKVPQSKGERGRVRTPSRRASLNGRPGAQLVVDIANLSLGAEKYMPSSDVLSAVKKAKGEGFDAIDCAVAAWGARFDDFIVKKKPALPFVLALKQTTKDGTEICPISTHISAARDKLLLPVAKVFHRHGVLSKVVSRYYPRQSQWIGAEEIQALLDEET